MLRKEPWLYILLLFLTACRGEEKVDPSLDTRFKGSINISADESFKPVIDAQVKVYEASYPEAKLNVHYKAEADCLKDLTADSVRLVIIPKRITEEERRFVADSMKVGTEQMLLAYDAIAVIVNPNQEITRFTVNELKQILQGNFKKNLIPVFDGLKATSTVRFIVDSVLRGDSLSKKTLAAKSSEEVVDYVSKNPDAVGFIGVSWIGNKDDEKQQSFLTKVRLAELECRRLPGQYCQPIQVNIYNGLYPFIRELVFILKENHKGLGYGFTEFMTSERGQLIFRRAYLVPGYLPFIVRPTKLRDK
jgi:phosphate transport system substrate-binding protein